MPVNLLWLTYVGWMADDEEKELQRMKTLLCVPAEDAAQAGRDVLGRIYAKVTSFAVWLS